MADVNSLRDIVAGSVALPGDDGFEAAAAGWNLAPAQRPIAVVSVADVADVAALVRAAPDLGVVLAAQPVGHSASEALSGSVLVRTGALDGVSIDEAAAIARVGAGAAWGQVVSALTGTGLIGLIGSNPTVSVAGFLLGGGMSWFGRRYGIAATHLRAVQIVDGRGGGPRWVDDDSDPDLMWALRGGGGEFGIVTALDLDLQREPQIHGGQLVFPAAAAAEVLDAFAEVTAAAPDGLTCWFGITHMPDLPFVPEEVRGQSMASVMLTWLGGPDDAAEPLARLRAAGPVLMDSVRAVPIEEIAAVADEPTDPLPAIDWATTVAGLDAETRRGIIAIAADRDATALLGVEIRHLGGAFRGSSAARRGACDHLDGEYSVGGLGLVMAPESVPAIRQSIRELRSVVVDVDLDRVSPTFLGPDSPATRAFDPQTLERLRAVKRAADPDGIFRSYLALGRDG